MKSQPERRRGLGTAVVPARGQWGWPQTAPGLYGQCTEAQAELHMNEAPTGSCLATGERQRTTHGGRPMGVGLGSQSAPRGVGSFAKGLGLCDDR